MVIRRKSLGWQTRSHRLQLQKRYEKKFLDAGFKLTYKNIVRIDLAKKEKGQTYKSGIEKLFKRKTQQRNYRQRRKPPSFIEPPQLPVLDYNGTIWDAQDAVRENVGPNTKLEIETPWYSFDGNVSDFDYSEFLEEGNEYFENEYGDENGYWRKELSLHIHETLSPERVYNLIRFTFNDSMMGSYLGELTERGFIK